MSTSIIVESLRQPSEADRVQLRAIYEAGFPPSEREPFEDVVAAIAEGVVQLAVARDLGSEDRRVMGLAVIVRIPDSALWYISYFAIDEIRRGGGLGSQLFHAMTDLLAKGGEGDILIWEIEPETLDEPDSQPNRRIRFYERLGAQILTAVPGYYVPNFEDGGMLHLRLMWLPLRGPRPAPGKAELIEWVTALYHTAYPNHLHFLPDIITSITL